MTLNDLKSFWGKDNKVAKRASKTYRLPDYNLPPLEDINGNVVFKAIARHIVQSEPELLEEQGYLDLDKQWKSNPNLESTRNDPSDKEGKSLFEAYPKPFAGRKVYLCYVALETRDKTTDEGIEQKRVIQGIKEFENRGQIRVKFGGRVCVLHNKDLFYNPNVKEDTRKDMNDKGEIVDVPNDDPYQYRYASFFTSKDLAYNVLFPHVKKVIAKDNTAFRVAFFAITPYIGKKPKDNAPENPTPSDYWYNCSLDDVILV